MPPCPEDIRPWLRLLFRDVAAPTLGLAILVHDALLTSALRPWAMIVGATLLGYPVADRIDGWLQRATNGKDHG